MTTGDASAVPSSCSSAVQEHRFVDRQQKRSEAVSTSMCVCLYVYIHHRTVVICVTTLHGKCQHGMWFSNV